MKMTNPKKLLITFGLLLLLQPIAVLAITDNVGFTGDTNTQLQKQDTEFLRQTGLGTKPLSVAIAKIIQVALSFLGLIFVILIIYAGFIWLLSAGNEEKIGRAKAIIIAGVIGLTIVLSAYIITIFVINNILQATGISL